MERDVPEDVAQEMVESGYVCEGDHKTMAKAIKDRVSLIKRKREQRQLVREEQEKENKKRAVSNSRMNNKQVFPRQESSHSLLLALAYPLLPPHPLQFLLK